MLVPSLQHDPLLGLLFHKHHGMAATEHGQNAHENINKAWNWINILSWSLLNKMPPFWYRLPTRTDALFTIPLRCIEYVNLKERAYFHICHILKANEITESTQKHTLNDWTAHPEEAVLMMNCQLQYLLLPKPLYYYFTSSFRPLPLWTLLSRGNSRTMLVGLLVFGKIQLWQHTHNSNSPMRVKRWPIVR